MAQPNRRPATWPGDPTALDQCHPRLRLYNVPEQHVLFTPYDAAFAFKATLPRLVPAGDFGDTDVYGCQQHAPLLDVDLPI